MSASDPTSGNRIFISCVTKEFEDCIGPFQGFRTRIAKELRAADCEVKVQEDFRQTDEDTVEKLDHYIRRCAAVIQYPSDKPIIEPADLAWTLIGDLRYIIPTLPAPQPRLSPPKFIHLAAEHFLGREPQLTLLDEAWSNGTNVLSIIAWGGVGKTALITERVQTRFIDHGWQSVVQPSGLSSGAAVQRTAPHSQPALAAYFDWTFYDQGTRSLADGTESRTGSVGDFFEQALVFFGDPDPNLPGKGRRLADLIRQQRSLIILDGLEPLQQPPGHPQDGRLLDPDLRDLLAALAQSNPGLCLITSRQALTDIDGLRRKVYVSHDLEDLPITVAIQLLRQFDIQGRDDELADACEKFQRHALSLTLLGRFLSDAHGGDIRRIDRVDLQRADELTRPERHRSVWRILENYEAWLAQTKDDGSPKTLSVLRLTGLFDRTANADCLAALRAKPIIPSLTAALSGMAEDEWNILLKRLERAHLIKLRESSNLKSSITTSVWAIDAHPLIREYFGKQLKQTQPEAFKIAHSRLFDHLCETTEYRPDTLLGLQPLYQAVKHGCNAERQQEACEMVFKNRILRGTGSDGNYSVFKLGAINADMGALIEFFDEQWTRPSSRLSEVARDWHLNEAGFRLRASGQLKDALEALHVASQCNSVSGNAKSAATSFSNLSSVEATVGDLNSAIRNAKRCVEFADRNGDAYWPSIARSTLANALSNSGDHVEAQKQFAEAESIQARRQPKYPLLYSASGFLYCSFPGRLEDACG